MQKKEKELPIYSKAFGGVGHVKVAQNQRGFCLENMRGNFPK